MKIGIWGYGKMGKEIEKIALERGHEIVWKITSQDNIEDYFNQSVDAVIDFTVPETALKNIEIGLSQNWKMIMGTTGWYDEIPAIKERVEKEGHSFLYASNFSLGVNISFQVNELLAKLMSPHDNYKASIDEIHHTQKLDAPSGTAITFAEGITENHNGYDQWKLDGTQENKTLPVYAHREGDVKGTHIVTYQSEIDTITLKHEAHNRKGFALGSVIAAEWLQDKKGFFTMQDVLKS